MDALFYHDYVGNWDDDLFRKQILKYIKSTTILLEVGAGTGRIKQMNFRGIAAKTYGIDPDPRVLSNPFLDTALVGYGESMPFSAAKFDLVISNNVLEHLLDPIVFFREISRVLKPKGFFITKTPNKNHYMPMIAGWTPISFHKWYNSFRGRGEADTFPTVYKVNTWRSQKMTAISVGFKIVEINYYEGRPEYLRLNVLTYLVGICYERLINWFGLNRFKVLLITTFQKHSSFTIDK
jgi:SAM-dependent methyltransferase